MAEVIDREVLSLTLFYLLLFTYLNDILTSIILIFTYFAHV